jgi:molybdenum cofactor cytidylyltransferase
MAGNCRMCGVILSAGFSARMGRDKALLPWPPGSPESRGTLLSASIAALKPFTEIVIVVAGKNIHSLAPIATSGGAILIENTAPERGQFSSLQTGLRDALARNCNAAMITLVDCPPLSASSLERLRTAFDEAVARGHWAVAPEHNGKRGHPLIAGRELIDAFLAAPLTSNAREVKHANAHQIESIPVADEWLTVDVNTPEQYAALANSAIHQQH